jgi:hypothetical protein
VPPPPPFQTDPFNHGFTHKSQIVCLNFLLLLLLLVLQVDESVLSSDTGEDPPLPPPPHISTIPTSYPWIQMALPGGGIVSVPLETTSSGAGSVKNRNEDDLGSPDRHLVQPLQPTSVSGVHNYTASTSGSIGSVTQADLLTVATGEPVTHFNLDQLLEIVQSFQLDTTMAGHDETSQQAAHDLAIVRNLPMVSKTFLALTNVCISIVLHAC